MTPEAQSAAIWRIIFAAAEERPSVRAALKASLTDQPAESEAAMAMSLSAIPGSGSRSFHGDPVETSAAAAVPCQGAAHSGALALEGGL